MMSNITVSSNLLCKGSKARRVSIVNNEDEGTASMIIIHVCHTSYRYKFCCGSGLLRLLLPCFCFIGYGWTFCSYKTNGLALKITTKIAHKSFGRSIRIRIAL